MIKEKSELWARISLLIGKIVSIFPFPPSFYSWATLPCAIAAVWLISKGWILSALIFFLMAGILDVVDGGVARVTSKVSARGAFLDGSLDRVVDFLILWSFFYLPLETFWLSAPQWIFIAGFGVIMPSFVVAYANHRKAVFDPEEKKIWRIMNRGEIYILMLGVIVSAKFNPRVGGIILMILCILTWVTIIQSFILALIKAYHNQL